MDASAFSVRLRSSTAVFLCAFLCFSSRLSAQSESVIFEGIHLSDEFGSSVDGAGDLNQDGFQDVLVGAPNFGANGSAEGMAQVFSGLDGQVLFNLFGGQGNNSFGAAVSRAFDVNADGFDDVLVGANYGIGYLRVYSGKTGSVIHDIPGGAYPESFGTSVSELGDVDGDGYADFLGGAPFHSGTFNEAGRAQVYSGKTGLPLFTWLGSGKGHFLGMSLAGVGDVNLDGHLDIGIGVPRFGAFAQRTGAVMIHSGQDGSLIHQMQGSGQYSGLGSFVGYAGDVDADGHPDILGGDPFHGSVQHGVVRVLSGATGAEIFSLAEEENGAWFGHAATSIGDVTGDGHDDFAIGAPGQSGGTIFFGTVKLYSGADGELLDELRVQTSSSSLFGYCLSAAGDVDGDGKGDLIVGSPDDVTPIGLSGSARIYSGSCFGDRTYGTGDYGSGGIVPRLTSSGLPRLGNGEFSLVMTGGRGGSPAVLLVGSATASFPVSFGTLYVDPFQPLVPLSLVLGGAPGVAGEGGFSLPAPIPNQNALLGTSVYLQVLVADPISQGGASHTAGLVLTLCR